MDTDNTITVREANTMFTRETTRIRSAMRRVATEFRRQNAGKLSRADLELIP